MSVFRAILTEGQTIKKVWKPNYLVGLSKHIKQKNKIETVFAQNFDIQRDNGIYM